MFAPEQQETVTAPSDPGSHAPRLGLVGDLVLDIVVSGMRAIEAGSDVPGTIRFRAGGSAANSARSFAGLGGGAVLITAVGADAWGRRLTAAVRSEGVTVHAVVAARPTARLICLVGPDGERSFVTDRGAADELRVGDVLPRWLRALDGLHLPGYSLFTEPLASAAAHCATVVAGAGGVVSVDLASRAPLLAMGRRRAWDAVAGIAPDVLLATVGEAAALLGARREEARLLELATIVVIKEGSAGCRILTGAPAPLSVATRPLRATDTTGAGDAFTAGFLHVLLAAEVGTKRPWDAALLRRAARSGHRAAAALLRRPRAELTI